MPPRDEDWSDSDDENLSEIETSVLLGVPDGAIDTASDLLDAAVSRIGGHPAFLPSHEPSFTSSQCKICSNPCELLVQIWCPFEDSPFDRSLYVWGCSKPSCQGKSGSIRAWRGLRRNDKYAAKLEQKLARKRQAEEASARAAAAKREATQAAQAAAKVNPFSMKPTAGSGAFGGFGNQIFGSESESPVTPPSTTEKANEVVAPTQDDGDDSESSEEDDELLTAMASVTVNDESAWKATPSYTPLYLSTVSEYLPPEAKPKVPTGAQVPDVDDNDSKGKGGNAWASETYENSLEMDHVFERFTKRVGCEGEQCVRYELNGTPLPYSSDSIFTSLFPSPPSTAPVVTNVTRGAFQPPLPKRSYFPTATTISNCPICRSKRVFECQLMPNLINILRKGDDKDDTTKTATHGEKLGMSGEERRKAVELELKGEGGAGSGMDWGTCMIFSCEKDCCLDDARQKDARECWREELVLIQKAL